MIKLLLPRAAIIFCAVCLGFGLLIGLALYYPWVLLSLIGLFVAAFVSWSIALFTWG